LLLHESRCIAINAKLALRSCVGIFRNERTRSTQLDPKLMFRTVSLLHESWCKTGRTDAINAQVRLTNLRRNFSQRTHLVLYIWPKTHVLGCFGLFRYCMKVDAKLAKLAPLTPNFARRSCVAFFCYERTRFTPMDPKLMFWGVSGCFVTARKSCKTSRTGAINAQVR
jgi:hypothetical protein